MWMSSEDARSDFVLAAAAVLLGGLAVSLLQALPFYPDLGSTLGALLYLAWVFVLTALVPVLLIRYRDQELTAGTGLGGERAGVATGLLVALPIVAVGYLRGLPDDGLARAVLGRFDGSLIANPVVGAGGGSSVIDLFLNVLFVAVLAVSGLVFYGFLVTRAREAFRQHDLSIVEALRTFGMAAAGAALLLGLLVVVAGSARFTSVLLHVGALVVAVLLTDRLVTTSQRTTRATMLAPALVALLAQVLAFGGLFRGDLLLGLFHGVLSAGLVVVVAALIESRRYGWAIVPVAVATAIYPTCLSLPVAFNATLSPYC